MKPSATSSRKTRRCARAAAGVLAAASALAVLVHGRAAGIVEKGPALSAARESLSRDRLYPVPFGDGETLVYTIAWLKIEGGEMTLRTSRETSTDGVPVHRIALIASSNDYVSKFYPVRDLYETWVDARDFQPLRFEKHAREGRYESDEVEEFDLTRRIGSWREDRTPPARACAGHHFVLLFPEDPASRRGSGRPRRHVLARQDLQAQGLDPRAGEGRDRGRHVRRVQAAAAASGERDSRGSQPRKALPLVLGRRAPPPRHGEDGDADRLGHGPPAEDRGRGETISLSPERAQKSDRPAAP